MFSRFQTEPVRWCRVLQDAAAEVQLRQGQDEVHHGVPCAHISVIKESLTVCDGPDGSLLNSRGLLESKLVQPLQKALLQLHALECGDRPHTLARFELQIVVQEGVHVCVWVDDALLPTEGPTLAP